MSRTQWQDYKVHVPERESGDWRVERFEISEEDARLHAMRCTFGGYGSRGVTAGQYTKLVRGNTTVMSDTRAEIIDHYPLFSRAVGRGLLNGLGLGVALKGVLQTADEVWVIENSPDVLNLVANYYLFLAKALGKILKIVQADAMEYRPPKGEHFEFVWHDIWDDLCTDNLTQMHTLHRRYGRRTNWQASWGRDFLEWRRQDGY